jgi:hypothetical protein
MGIEVKKYQRIAREVEATQIGPEWFKEVIELPEGFESVFVNPAAREVYIKEINLKGSQGDWVVNNKGTITFVDNKTFSETFEEVKKGKEKKKK